MPTWAAPNVHVHRGKVVPGKDATCAENGMKTYYVCDCGARFYDEACTQPIGAEDDLSIPATGKHIDGDGDNICDMCGAKLAVSLLGDVNGDNKVDTGDALLILQYAAKLIEHFPVSV